jgi:hypothetical protein
VTRVVLRNNFSQSFYAGEMSTDNQQDFDSRADKLWSIYNKEAENHDRSFMETWKDDIMDSIIIFVRLHSTNPDFFSSCLTSRLVSFLPF